MYWSFDIPVNKRDCFIIIVIIIIIIIVIITIIVIMYSRVN